MFLRGTVQLVKFNVVLVGSVVSVEFVFGCFFLRHVSLAPWIKPPPRDVLPPRTRPHVSSERSPGYSATAEGEFFGRGRFDSSKKCLSEDFHGSVVCSKVVGSLGLSGSIYGSL